VPGVEVRTLTELPALVAACDLFDEVWHPAPDARPMTVDVLRALTLVGNYAAGAYADGALVGASVGFFADPDSRSLHSHVTAVAAAARGLGVGPALKLHQRGWALDRGVGRITWTFDPLVRRNAHVNLVKLAATPQAYLPDFYGSIDDALNAGDASDRLLVAWELESPAVAAAVAGRPAVCDPPGAVVALRTAAGDRPETVDADGDVVLVGVPADIEALRTGDPALAGEWRAALRAVLGGLLAAGGRVLGFTLNGSYAVRRPR
jgi:predicted GNAT superfamily acetyltransferase